MGSDVMGVHHDHVDGSRAVYDIIEDLYALADKEFPFQDKDAWLAYFTDPQTDIVEKFGTVTGVLQSAESLRTLGAAYAAHRAQEGIAYVEAKFAPQYHVGDGLTMAEATAALIEGFRRGESQHLIVVHPVVCIGREASESVGMEIARIALEYDGEVSLDLVCDEANHPPEKHLAAYRLTKDTNVKRDCHAGEWVAPGPGYRDRLRRNVRTAVELLEVDGLGHAIPLIDDPELVRMVVDRGIRVSWCPMSNIVCGAITDVRELRIDELLDAGVVGTINPDDDLFMPTAQEAMDACIEAYGFSEEQRVKLTAAQFTAAFSKDVRPASSMIGEIVGSDRPYR